MFSAYVLYITKRTHDMTNQLTAGEAVLLLDSVCIWSQETPQNFDSVPGAGHERVKVIYTITIVSFSVQSIF